METIDITPTWSSLMSFMMAILEDPTLGEEAKKPIREELRRLAQFADEVIRINKTKTT